MAFNVTLPYTRFLSALIIDLDEKSSLTLDYLLETKKSSMVFEIILCHLSILDYFSNSQLIKG